MPSISEHIAQMTKALPEIAKFDDVSEAWCSVFLDAFYSVYLATREGVDPSIRAEIDAFLQASAASVDAVKGLISHVQICRLEGKFESTWEAEEWLTVCRYRSALEGINELYGPLLADFEPIGQDEDTDANLKEHARSQGFASYEEAPEVFPDTHWWWHFNKPLGKFGM